MHLTSGYGCKMEGGFIVPIIKGEGILHHSLQGLDLESYYIICHALYSKRPTEGLVLLISDAALIKTCSNKRFYNILGAFDFEWKGVKYNSGTLKALLTASPTNINLKVVNSTIKQVNFDGFAHIELRKKNDP